MTKADLKRLAGIIAQKFVTTERDVLYIDRKEAFDRDQLRTLNKFLDRACLEADFNKIFDEDYVRPDKHVLVVYSTRLDEIDKDY